MPTVRKTPVQFGHNLSLRCSSGTPRSPTIKSAAYCETQQKLRKTIKNRQPGQYKLCQLHIQRSSRSTFKSPEIQMGSMGTYSLQPLLVTLWFSCIRTTGKLNCRRSDNTRSCDGVRNNLMDESFSNEA